VLKLVEPEEIKFFPGQYLDITVPDTEQSRSFSMANVPGREGHFEFVIKVYPNGLFSEFLATKVAVGDRLEVLLDSGIRRGTDVATALALGAQAVLAGRMPLWGLASGGEEGARQVLELLREELATALHLMGCRSLAELSAENLVRRP
jgi:hypothetical protein